MADAERGEAAVVEQPVADCNHAEKPADEEPAGGKKRGSLREKSCLYKLTRCRLPLIIDIPLRGLGQVIFCDNDITGVIFLIALAIADQWLTVLALVGCVAGVLVGAAASFDTVFLRMGLTAYNGVLVGCGFAVFMPDGAWTWRPAIATLVGGGIQAFITLACANMSSVPAWTFPFNYVLLASLLMFREDPEPTVDPVGNATLAVVAKHFTDVDAVDMIAAIPVGISQIFVVNNWISGILIVVGIAVHDMRLSFCVVVGSTIGLLTGMAMGADAGALTDGLWGYNPALTAASVCVFFQHTRQIVFLIFWGCIATQVLSAGMATAFGDAFRIPICTVPFCILATFIFLMRNHLKGYETPHTMNAPKFDRSSGSFEEDAVEPSEQGDEEEHQRLNQEPEKA